MPKVPQVETCCLCASTETGSKIIGWYLLISGLIKGISWIIKLIASLGNKQSDSKTDIIVEIILEVIVVLLGLYLLLGVYRRNMRYVKLWLTFATIYLVILAIGVVLVLFTGHLDVLNQLINFILVAYFIVVVYSFYRENLNTAPATY